MTQIRVHFLPTDYDGGEYYINSEGDLIRRDEFQNTEKLIESYALKDFVEWLNAEFKKVEQNV